MAFNWTRTHKAVTWQRAEILHSVRQVRTFAKWVPDHCTLITKSLLQPVWFCEKWRSWWKLAKNLWSNRRTKDLGWALQVYIPWVHGWNGRGIEARGNFQRRLYICSLPLQNLVRFRNGTAGSRTDGPVIETPVDESQVIFTRLSGVFFIFQLLCSLKESLLSLFAVPCWTVNVHTVFLELRMENFYRDQILVAHGTYASATLANDCTMEPRKGTTTAITRWTRSRRAFLALRQFSSFPIIKNTSRR